MKARYIQRGDSADYVPEAAVAAGDVVRVGTLTGVAKLDIAPGELGAVALVGVYELKTKDGKAFAPGASVWFDPTDGTATPDKPAEGGAAFWFGHAMPDAKAGESFVRVRLEQAAEA